MATVLWSRHPILRSDETWLPEWSSKLGVEQQCAVRSRGGVLGQASLSDYGVKPVGYSKNAEVSVSLLDDLEKEWEKIRNTTRGNHGERSR
jgi:hypothetical protein